MKQLSHPIQITFRNLPPSSAAATRVRAEAAKLERSFRPIMSCRVLIEAPHRRHHHHDGAGCRLRVEIGVPGDDIVVVREPSARRRPAGADTAQPTKAPSAGPAARRQDFSAALRDAFALARHRLEEHARRRRGTVKVHLPADAPLPV